MKNIDSRQQNSAQWLDVPTTKQARSPCECPQADPRADTVQFHSILEKVSKTEQSVMSTRGVNLSRTSVAAWTARPLRISELPDAHTSRLPRGGLSSSSVKTEDHHESHDAHERSELVLDCQKPEAQFSLAHNTPQAIGDPLQTSVQDHGLPRIRPAVFFVGPPLGDPKIDQAFAGWLPSQPVSVAVQQQAAHFRPIVEGFTTKDAGPSRETAVSEGIFDADGQTFGPVDNISPNPRSVMRLIALGHGGGIAGNSSDQATAKFATSWVSAHEHQGATLGYDQATATGGGVDRVLPAQSLVLERVVGAVLAEAQQALAEADPLSPSPNAGALLAVKTSGAVMRTLCVQLHASDLGPITIQMRLSGGNLELEIHTASEGSAHLLKSGIGRLADHLREAGYSPSAIAVHSAVPGGRSWNEGELSQQHWSPHHDPHSSGRNAQHQWSGSRQKDPRSEHEEEKSRNGTGSESIFNLHTSGGVYL